MQGYNADNNGVGYTLIVGSYYIDDTATTMRGFVTILDNDFDIVQTITQYSSGTYLGIFEAINVGTDGNFFGIENNNGIKRFVMLNNIIAKLPSETEYKVVLRQSYNVPDTSNYILQVLRELLRLRVLQNIVYMEIILKIQVESH